MAKVKKPLSAYLCIVLVLLISLVVPILGQKCGKANPCATGCCSKDGWCGTGDEHCSAENCVDTCDYKLQCDKNNPCETGCCSNAGFCGLGPDYCAKDVCVASCDAKAECDPGFGLEWAKSSKCPLNVCCSEFGFCGTTKEFCGSKTVKHDTCDKKTATLDRVVGYYEAWASRRPCNAYWPEQIPLGIYTHINFAFATIDPKTFEVRPDADGDLDHLMRVTQLKTMDPDLKVLIALGGWTFNDPGPTQTVFSDLARSDENQNKFFASLKHFLSAYHLDGVDLDWEYPEADDRNGRPEDFANFPKFIANLKKALQETGGRDELSITLPSSFWYLQHFDIVKLEPHVSFFNIMSYDLHGKWDLGNKWTGEYLDAHTNVTEIDKALELLWRNKIDSSKVVLGLAFYARAYTLADPGCVTPGCMFASGANQGDCSREVGILLNNEIDDIVKKRNLKSTFYKDADVEVIHWDDQWLSYDDAKTLELKADYARQSCLGGVMVWAISHDTQDAKYSTALGKVTHRTKITMPGMFLEKDATITPNPYTIKVEEHLQCKWSNCGEFCPPGWTMMTRDDKWQHTDDEIMLDDTACTSPHARRLCCPPSETKPSCGWYSFKGGACYGECPTGYSEVGSLNRGCRSGYQAACCTTEDSDRKLLNATRLYEKCEWSNSPDCSSGKCTFAGSAWPTEFIESSTGSGAAYCYSGQFYDENYQFHFGTQYRKYCCDTSNQNATWGTCKWRDDVKSIGTSGKTCMSGCKSNELKVAMEGNDECHGKDGGAKSYCCTGTYTATTKVYTPVLSEYEAELSGWAESPTCEARTGLDLYTRSEMSERDQIPLKPSNRYYSVTALVLAKMIRGTALGTTTTSISSLFTLWDKYIAKHWENLTAKKITSWINDRTGNPTAQLHSPEQWADWILCNPDGFDGILDAGTGSHVICDHFEITDKDYLAADGSSVNDGTLTKKWLAELDALNRLEKRGPAAARSIKCLDRNKKERTIRFQSQPYPSAGDWDNNAEPVQNVVDLLDWRACRSSAIGLFNQGADRSGYATEHLLEIDSISMFFEWAVKPENDKEECQDIDCLVIADFFNKKSLESPPDLPGLDASHQQIPMQRVMESLGSETNRENFAILWSSINLNKAQIWQNRRPRTEDTFSEYVEDDLDKAVELIRDSIAVYQYMREAKIWKKFKSINEKVRDEMKRAQEQYKKTNKKDMKFLDCYDAWLNYQLGDFVNNGKNWVKDAIDEVKREKKPAESKENDPDGHKFYDALTTVLDILQQEADVAIQSSHFSLAKDDGDAMDTSD